MSYFLPIPPKDYDSSIFARAFEQIAQSLRGTYSKGSDIEFGNKDQKLIIRSPNDTKYQITVDNSSNLSTTIIT